MRWGGFGGGVGWGGDYDMFLASSHDGEKGSGETWAQLITEGTDRSMTRPH